MRSTSAPAHGSVPWRLVAALGLVASALVPCGAPSPQAIETIAPRVAPTGSSLPAAPPPTDTTGSGPTVIQRGSPPQIIDDTSPGPSLPRKGDLGY